MEEISVDSAGKNEMEKIAKLWRNSDIHTYPQISSSV